MPVSFSFGGKPVDILLTDMQREVKATRADILWALNYQKSIILERTARGVDAEERTFAPYSNNGPYYYYPPGGEQAAKRLFKKLGGTKQSQEQGVRAFNQLRKFKGVKIGGNTMIVSGSGIKFPSYAAFKRANGRNVVDLLGIRAPHMLQAITVLTSAAQVGKFGDGVLGEARLGIYGSEADRAQGHNTGAGHLPKREFFAISTRDADRISEQLDERIKARLRKVMQ